MKCNSYGRAVPDGGFPHISEFIHSAQTREGEETRSGVEQCGKLPLWEALIVSTEMNKPLRGLSLSLSLTRMHAHTPQHRLHTQLHTGL